MERIAASGVPIERPEDERLIDAKEAVAFGWLGLLRALNLPNTLPSATGARIASSSGALWGRFPR
jgi:1,6-anhydro-N-acetylmuramate kinase